MKRITLKIISVILVLTVFAFPVSANPPEQVTIVSEMDLLTSTGTFEAYGAAVDAGVLCPDGTVYDFGLRPVGYQSGLFVNFFIHKLFVCNDSSGSFEMDMNVRLINSTSETTAIWYVVAGSDTYARLRGSGTLTGVPGGENVVIDTYTGKFHID